MSCALIALLLSSSIQSGNTDALKLWNDFTQTVREGRMTAAKVRPYYENLREPLLRWVENIRTQTRAEDWQAAPEIHHTGDDWHFLVPLTAKDGKKVTYCFTLTAESGTWYFK
ncbi:MAG: hypothetical protein M1541_10825, partial [Acidobacteria bacterium]|nr:hypothetical protein [Acidobacteriota bacterium]